ncbi:hypothetical protein [Ktedonospora formicarum]|nr:hypothetical protein [Ktedonospora formicarum]
MNTSNKTKKSIIIDILLTILCLALPLGSFALWYSSLNAVATQISHMNGLGLVSIMPPELIGALVIMMVSFCITLQKVRYYTPLLLLHFGLIIIMLYGVTTLVEQAPRFSVVYTHAGYTEYIIRTGSVNPHLSAYFNWPGFFILSAFVTQLAGYQTILSYAAWAPVFNNVITLAALYFLFTTFTTNRRVIWLALWLFCITNWIGQDYFSPQGLFFCFYIVILAILLKWFKTPSDESIRSLGPRLSRLRFLPSLYTWLTAPDPLSTPSQRRKKIALLLCVLVLFSFTVYGHQLTPFFTIVSVTALIVFRRCTLKLWWLPIVMTVMTLFWMFIMAHTYLAGHMNQVFGGLSQIFVSLSSNVSDRVGGDPQHALIARLRIIMTFFVWAVAFVGALFRLGKGYKDASVVLLALAPFPLFIVQPYGGEMLLRCYLFSLPSMIFLAASVVYEKPPFPSFFSRLTMIKLPWKGLVMSSLTIILLGGFLFTRYGNENIDYKTYDEVNGVQMLYSIAPSKALFVAGWTGTPWQMKNFEKFRVTTLATNETLSNDIITLDVRDVVHFMQDQQRPQTYMIFTRSQKAWFDAMSGYPVGSLDKFEEAINSSGEFTLIYRTTDVQIYQLTSSLEGDQ